MFLERLWVFVASQDYPLLEWLIEDDSDEEHVFFRELNDPRVSYVHYSEQLTVGVKRNNLADRSRGTFIVHFDDDDYYAPGYVLAQISALTKSGAELIKLCGFYVYDQRSDNLFYWDQTDRVRLRFTCKSGLPLSTRPPGGANPSRAEQHQQGFGFSYVYSRSLWGRLRFADVTLCEDLDFVSRAQQIATVTMLQDHDGICIHVIHRSNLSGCYPQFIFPPFLMVQLFPEAYTRLKSLGIT